MQYSVPQFVNIEDRIVGPLTGKQVLYLLIGGATLLIFFSFFDFGFFIIFAIPIIILTLLFAFYKPKGQTVATYILIFFNYFTIPRAYIWRREPSVVKFKRSQKKQKGRQPMQENITRNRLRELAWVLDTSQAVGTRFEVSKRE
jgi:membrane protein implicated in regulation of membrane protease activity